MLSIRSLLVLVGLVGAAIGLRELARRSNTQVHRINS